jgi:release factor glutamine methyltransferase
VGETGHALSVRVLGIGKRDWGIGKRDWGIGKKGWGIGKRNWGVGETGHALSVRDYNNCEKMQYLELVERLLGVYDKQEAESVLRIAAQDIFGLDSFNQAGLTLSAADQIRLELVISRLLQREPIQYIAEKAYFYEDFFYVNRSVLIPRPETEELIYHISSYYKKNPSPKQVLDVGTGSGCIAICLKKLFANANVQAIDVSAEALEVAQANKINIGVEIGLARFDFLDSSLWARMNEQLFGTAQLDLLVSNPPYIGSWETDRMSENTIFEPRLALFVEGQDTLVFYKNLSNFAGLYLGAGGVLFAELNAYDAEATKVWFEQTGQWASVDLLKDIGGKWRVLKAIKKQ